MERRLRIQLTLSVLASLVVLLGVMFLGTYMTRRAQVDADADKSIDTIVEEGGELPKDLSGYSNSKIEGFYEMRYLVARVASDGTLEETNLDHVATIVEGEAQTMVGRALARGGDRGYVGKFRYDVRAEKDGTKVVVLLDRARQLEALNASIASELKIYGAGVVVVTVIFLLLSKRIVQPIVRAHESQRQFVIDAGHDLRTPLSIISADADVLAMDVGKSEWIDDIKSQVDVMSGLTESLIVLSRASTENERGAGVVNLSDVVSREARGFKSRTLTEDHPLASDVCDGIYVRGNEQYLQRMVGALIDNALKYSVDGGAIEVRLERRLHQAELSVRNATEGVDPKEVGRWFGRFYQSDRARTHEAGGYGIGLSMVEAVVRAHGGKVHAEAEADGGSVTMTVTLPTTRDPTQRAWRHETEGDSDER